jgi:hypothetical protein
MSITIQEFAFPAPVVFDPPLPPGEMVPSGVTLPVCPACGEGTVFVNVCGRCGSNDPGPYCCGEYPSSSGAYLSVLPGEHSWLGCPLTAGNAA